MVIITPKTRTIALKRSILRVIMCASLKKKVTRKQSRLNKPWLSNALIKCIKTKNSLYKKYLRNPTMDCQSIYQNYKNKLNHSLRIAKRLYNEKKWNNVQSNTRATWKVLHEILNRSKRNSNRCSTFKSECTEKSSKIGKSWPQLKTWLTLILSL